MERRNSGQAAIKDLTQGPLAKQLILFSLPIMGGNLLQALYTLVDLWAVGNFASAAAISAVSISGQIVFLIHTVSIGLNNGGQVLISQQVGAKDLKQLRVTIGTMLSFCLLATIITAIIGTVGSNLWLGLMSTPSETWSDAVSYLFICCLGAPFMSFSGTLCAILRGAGNSRTPMYIMAVSAVLNMVLDIWFVAGLGWGAAGAAWATTIAQVIGSVYSFACVYRIREQLGFDFSPAAFRIELATLKVLLQLGAPLIIMNVSINISMMVVISFVNVYGVAASAMTGIGSKLHSIISVLTGSMQTAVSSMVAQNFAARKIDRVRQSNRASNLICLGFFAVIGVAVWFFPEQIVGLFTQDSETEILALARPYMRAALAMYLACCLMSTPLGHINGVGFTTLNLIIAILDGVIARIGLAILFGKVLGFGVTGFWWGSSVSAYVSVIMGFGYYFFGRWEKRKLLMA